MDIPEIRRRVEEIRTNVNDPEVAHSLEDELLRGFVEWIAENLDYTSVTASLAREVTKSFAIDFPRWKA